MFGIGFKLTTLLFFEIFSTLIDPAGWLECKSLATSKVSSLNQLRTTLASVLHTSILSKNLLLLHQNSRFTGQKHERTVKSSIYRLKLALTAKSFNSSNKNSNERGKTSIYQTKLQQAVKNLDPPNKSSNERWRTSNYRSKLRTNGEKTPIHRTETQRTVENAENGCTSTQPHKNLRNFKNSRCGWETGFTRPHGGRLMILPVDSSARVLPRQRYLLSISFAPR